jgi:hypothetical protein
VHAGFEEGVGLCEDEGAEAVGVDAVFEGGFECGEGGAEGVSGVAEEPVIDFGGDGEVAEPGAEAIGVLSVGDGGGGEVVGGEFFLELGRFFIVTVGGEEFGFVIAEGDDDFSAVGGGAGLEGAEELEDFEALRAFVDHIAGADEGGVSAGPFDGGGGGGDLADEVSAGEEVGGFFVVAVDIAEGVDGGDVVDGDDSGEGGPVARRSGGQGAAGGDGKKEGQSVRESAGHEGPFGS